MLSSRISGQFSTHTLVLPEYCNGDRKVGIGLLIFWLNINEIKKTTFLKPILRYHNLRDTHKRFSNKYIPS